MLLPRKLKILLKRYYYIFYFAQMEVLGIKVGVPVFKFIDLNTSCLRKNKSYDYQYKGLWGEHASNFEFV